MDLSYFRHWTEGIRMTWDDGEPTIADVYTPKLEALLGPARRPDEPITTEWGTRALGNRSIVADPRRADMRDIINTRIKFRERFRPFAPAVLEEAVNDYFVGAVPDPFMIQVYPVRPDKRAVIPAVTHVDGSGRLQTVSRQSNPRFWQLIRAFEKLSGVPVVLNTSFNENEPIVHKPEEALGCFVRTRMDALVLGNNILEAARS